MDIPAALEKVRIGETEIVLFMPDPIAVRQAFEKGELPNPYWSQVWPSAVALSLFLQANWHITKDKSVLELGAGLGLPSLAAAQNATEVICTDVEPEAVKLAAQSALHNQLQNFRVKVLDWMKEPVVTTNDVVLLSDVNYEPVVFSTLSAQVNELLNQGKIIILATPQRLLAKEFISPFLPFCIQKESIPVLHNETEVIITILVLQKEN